MKDGEVVTAGGRVLCVTALGNDIAKAQAKAYEVAKPFTGMIASTATISVTALLLA